MLTFSNFGLHVRLGNHLFQYATALAAAKRYGCELFLPPWKFSHYFDNYPSDPSNYNLFTPDLIIKEDGFNNYVPDLFSQYSKEDYQNKHIDISWVWGQSKKNWEDVEDAVLDGLKINEGFVNGVKEKYVEALSNKPIMLSIRLGDMKYHGGYYQFPIDYYALALTENFPDWENRNIIVFSDEPNVCRTFFKPLPNIYYADGNFGMQNWFGDPMEQLVLMTLCDDYVAGYSTFSWFGMYLGNIRTNGKIVRSPYSLDGEFKKMYDMSNYYPNDWIIYDHVGKQLTSECYKLLR